jgi:hypothetical protein
LADDAVPVSIGKRDEPGRADEIARILGLSAADVIRLHMSVIDREDRLESGTGEWLESFVSDESIRSSAARESVLRSLHTASDATNFLILSSLSEAVGTPIEDLQAVTGLGRLPLAERIGDLVSAGLAVKIPEANQIAGTAAGAAIVEMVGGATAVGETDLIREKR